MHIDSQTCKPKNAKVGQEGRDLRHVTYFHNLGIPVYICGMGEARDFKFGVHIDREAYQPKNAKVGHMKRGLRHVTYFYNLETFSISLEWV